MGMILDLLEDYFFRLTAVLSGFMFGWTGEPVYLSIGTIFMARVLYGVILEWNMVLSNEELDKLKNLFPEIPAPDNDREREAYMRGGERFFKIKKLLPPPIYVFLGYRASMDSTSVISWAVIALFMIALTVETVVVHDLAKRAQK